MGDGILSSFQSASDAVQCAKEISLEISNTNISLRIGIHLGEVVFEDGDVFGDGVNMASGLQELADPGTVYISGAVQKEIRNIAHIHTEFIAEKILKNVDEFEEIKQVMEQIKSPASVWFAWWDDAYSLMMAEGYAVLKEYDQGFRFLNRAIDYGITNIDFLTKYDHFLENLRSDERFEMCLNKARGIAENLRSITN